MKTQVIVFSTHAEPTLNHLIKEAAIRGQTITEKGKIFTFTPSEAARHEFKRETRKDANGVRHTDRALPSSFSDLMDFVGVPKD